MNKKIKKAWVAALRSGKYKKGEGALRDEQNNFCCLGVLCNLHAQAHPDVAMYQNDMSYIGCTGVLPEDVQIWADLAQHDPEVMYKNEARSLASLNDAGMSFKQIARIIEKQL